MPWLVLRFIFFLMTVIHGWLKATAEARQILLNPSPEDQDETAG